MRRFIHAAALCAWMGVGGAMAVISTDHHWPWWLGALITAYGVAGWLTGLTDR